MSGTYPTTPEFQAINVESKHNNLLSQTVSGRQQVRTLGGQQFCFTARYNVMTRAEFMPVFAFVTSQQGRLGSFTNRKRKRRCFGDGFGKRSDERWCCQCADRRDIRDIEGRRLYQICQSF